MKHNRRVRLAQILSNSQINSKCVQFQERFDPKVFKSLNIEIINSLNHLDSQILHMFESNSLKQQFIWIEYLFFKWSSNK